MKIERQIRSLIATILFDQEGEFGARNRLAAPLGTMVIAVLWAGSLMS